MLTFIKNYATEKSVIRSKKKEIDSSVGDIGSWVGGDELINPILKLFLTKGKVLCIESGQGIPKADISKDRYPHMTFLYTEEGIEQLLNFFDEIQKSYTDGGKAVSQQVLFHNALVEGTITPVVTWKWLNKDFTYVGHVNFFLTILRAWEKAYEKSIFSGMCENELRFIINKRIDEQQQKMTDSSAVSNYSTALEFEKWKG